MIITKGTQVTVNHTRFGKLEGLHLKISTPRIVNSIRLRHLNMLTE